MNNIKIAKQLIKIAKSLIASQLIGQTSYRLMNEQKKQISVNFSISTRNRDLFLGWCDSILGRPNEIEKLASQYGFKDMKDTIDDITEVNNRACLSACFSMCLKGEAECDLTGLINALKETYHCKEIK